MMITARHGPLTTMLLLSWLQITYLARGVESTARVEPKLQDEDDYLFHEGRCLHGLAVADFDLQQVEKYEEWFLESATFDLAETGTYTGPFEIREYVEGMRIFVDYSFREQLEILPISFNETGCIAHFATVQHMQTNPSMVGDAVCLSTVIGFTLHWIVDNSTITTEDESDFKFKVRKLNLYYSNPFLRRMFGEIFDTPQIRDFVCNTIMGPSCSETARKNNLLHHNECVTIYDTLESTAETGYMDDRTKGCRILHAAYATNNPEHCPHLSFVPQADSKGRVKCQDSKGNLPSDLFSQVEINFLQQISNKYGLGDAQYSECDLIPVLTKGPVKARLSPRVDANADAGTDNGNKFLRLHLFDPPIPCADGSPSGIYVERNAKVINSTNHVLVFIGESACADAKDCMNAYRMEPFKFTTDLTPATLEGHTILSRDSTINHVLHNYTKWLIPYCTQDFFLGDIKKGKVGNFTHAGSLFFDTVLKYWQGKVIENTALNETTVLDNVVVVGQSAGAIGVMNKIDKIRSIINSGEKRLQTANLKVMLDSPSVMSDLSYHNKNFKSAMVNYADLKEHPLCHPLHPISRAFERMSALPCCLSTHCLLRFDPRYSNLYNLSKTEWSTNDKTTNEHLLILDSAYDPFAITALLDRSNNTEDLIGAKEISNALHGLIEFGGSRLTRGMETATNVKLMAQQQELTHVEDFQNEARVKWIYNSYYQHTFVVPSVAILQLNCQYGNYEEEDYYYTCNNDGHAFELNYENFPLRFSQTISTWDNIIFQNESIHTIITSFVQDKFLERPNHPIELDRQTALLTLESPDVIDFRLEPREGFNILEDLLNAMGYLKANAYDVYSPYQYPWMTINYFILIWCASSAIYLCLKKYKGNADIQRTITSLDEDKKRNIVIYVVQILGSTFALFAQLYGGIDIIFHMKDETTRDRIEWAVLAIVSIAVIYIWELIYRLKIGWPLLIHHIVTIIFCQLSMASYFDTRQVEILRVALLSGFYATTEQPSFVALLFYRLDIYPRCHSFLFFSAGIATLILKTVVTIASMWQYAVFFRDEEEFDSWATFWRYAFIPILLMLYGSQLYACRILYLLGSRCQRRVQNIQYTITQAEVEDDDGESIRDAVN